MGWDDFAYCSTKFAGDLDLLMRFVANTFTADAITTAIANGARPRMSFILDRRTTTQFRILSYIDRSGRTFTLRTVSFSTTLTHAADQVASEIRIKLSLI